MKRSDLPYFAVVEVPATSYDLDGKIVEKPAKDAFLFGGSASATMRAEMVFRLDERRAVEDAPHIAIHLPVEDFERIEWETLRAITRNEEAAKASAPTTAEEIFTKFRPMIEDATVTDPDFIALEAASVALAGGHRGRKRLIEAVAAALPPNATQFIKGTAVGLAFAIAHHLDAPAG